MTTVRLKSKDKLISDCTANGWTFDDADYIKHSKFSYLLSIDLHKNFFGEKLLVLEITEDHYSNKMFRVSLASSPLKELWVYPIWLENLKEKLDVLLNESIEDRN